MKGSHVLPHEMSHSWLLALCRSNMNPIWSALGDIGNILEPTQDQMDEIQVPHGCLRQLSREKSSKGVSSTMLIMSLVLESDEYRKGRWYGYFKMHEQTCGQSCSVLVRPTIALPVRALISNYTKSSTWKFYPVINCSELFITFQRFFCNFVYLLLLPGALHIRTIRHSVYIHMCSFPFQ